LTLAQGAMNNRAQPRASRIAQPQDGAMRAAGMQVVVVGCRTILRALGPDNSEKTANGSDEKFSSRARPLVQR
jgi:hypothetical protein